MGQSPTTSIAFEAIGTAWNIELFDPMEQHDINELQQAIVKRIDTFDAHYSRFRKDSLVTAMAQRAGSYQLPADAKPMLDLYKSLYEHTGGAVTPLIGSSLSQAGYDAEYSLQPGVVTSPAPWDEIIDYQFPRLTLRAPALLDFGAAGKGYLVDIISTVIANHGIAHYCVNAGGDIYYQAPDAQELEVGLEHPDDPTQAIGIARLNNQSICGSSGNRRAWGSGRADGKAYHHIMDPHTLSSPQHTRALWVTAQTALLADGLATALFFSDAQSLQKHYTFEYAIVRSDYSLDCSANFPATFFTSQDNT